ncbi:MAG: pyruvate, phosphate dikinase [Syntrophomonadaceae bacterium]|nr:pyruvate, phosphate dikinase [Syntrophomonadaceae bacterium]
MGEKKKYVYLFEEGSADMKDLLGGKGAGLAEMTNIGLSVPPGLTITTEACVEYYKNGKQFPAGMEEQLAEKFQIVQDRLGKKFGDPDNPLLVSVRSGAPVSMPGMMDTILNLGLNDETVKGLAAQTNNERFALDCYRRFIQMFSDVVLKVDRDKFEHVLERFKEKQGVQIDADLSVDSLQKIVEEFKQVVRNSTGRDFPQDTQQQLLMAVHAVFNSWNNDKAILYRKINKIPDDLGTAVNVQCMVFGNSGNDSGTGVAFTRNPSTGEKTLYGEFLVNAQGEDVVAGIRTPQTIASMAEEFPGVFEQFVRTCQILEQHYRDMQDIEFTVERGKLYMLQTRTAKRTSAASIKAALDMVEEGLITKEEALLRVDPAQLNQLLHRQIDASATLSEIARGLPASPGAATGMVVFDANEAERLGKAGQKVILVRNETTPDDIHGIVMAQGVLTSRGGMTSHAAVVARSMGKPCICGAESITIDYAAKLFKTGSVVIKEGEIISMDGGTGRVFAGEVPMVEPGASREFEQLLQWADETRTLKIRANCDTPEDARKAREFGAEGIGLCRTEHMFMAQDRLPIVQQMILAESIEERQAALNKLLPMQQGDFYGIFEAMEGLPVTIRLLDPPLHEFLPNAEELLVELTKLRIIQGDAKEIAAKENLLNKVKALSEFNPMLGHRGCRLGITFPEIYAMQARAIFQAVAQLVKEGRKVFPEVEIPLVMDQAELAFLRQQTEEIAEQVMQEQGIRFEYKVGTMIELPRACLVADEIAKHADFFSFGTNDLTQTTFGFSRDDAEGKFLNAYVERKVLKESPFVVLDRNGVGQLMRLGIEKGRQTRPDLEIGICGEHGGEPNSIEFCHLIGLDYASCSTYRVPIARLAAAQAAINNKG